MDKIVMTIRENVKRLIALRGMSSRRELSKCAGIDQKTVNNLLTDIPSPSTNPTSINLRKMANALEVETWMLLLDDFPYSELSKDKPIRKISAVGYRMLEIFEGASAEKQKSMLDYAAYNLRENPGAERAIRVLQAKYNTKDSSMC